MRTPVNNGPRRQHLAQLVGQSRRKGAASTIVAVGIGIAEVRTTGRWSNGVIDCYIKKSHVRLAELDVLACVSALKNRELGQLPSAIGI